MIYIFPFSVQIPRTLTKQNGWYSMAVFDIFQISSANWFCGRGFVPLKLRVSLVFIQQLYGISCFIPSSSPCAMRYANSIIDAFFSIRYALYLVTIFDRVIIFWRDEQQHGNHPRLRTCNNIRNIIMWSMYSGVRLSNNHHWGDLKQGGRMGPVVKLWWKWLHNYTRPYIHTNILQPKETTVNSYPSNVWAIFQNLKKLHIIAKTWWTRKETLFIRDFRRDYVWTVQFILSDKITQLRCDMNS